MDLEGEDVAEASEAATPSAEKGPRQENTNNKTEKGTKQTQKEQQNNFRVHVDNRGRIRSCLNKPSELTKQNIDQLEK